MTDTQWWLPSHSFPSWPRTYPLAHIQTNMLFAFIRHRCSQPPLFREQALVLSENNQNQLISQNIYYCTHTHCMHAFTCACIYADVMLHPGIFIANMTCSRKCMIPLFHSASTHTLSVNSLACNLGVISTKTSCFMYIYGLCSCLTHDWYVTQGPKTCRLNHILHCICFEILFTVSKYLVSNWNSFIHSFIHSLWPFL